MCHFKYFSLFFLCIALQYNAIGQNEVYQSIKRLPIPYTKKKELIDSLLDKNISNKELIYFEEVMNRYANWLHEHDDKKCFDIINETINNHYGTDINLQDKYYSRSLYYATFGNYHKAIADLNYLLNLEKPTYVEYTYRDLGYYYFRIGNFIESIRNYKLSNKKFLEKKSNIDVMSNYLNSYNSYIQINTPHTDSILLHNLHEAVIISKRINPTNDTKYDLQRTLGIYYTIPRNRNLKKGTFYIKNALDLALKQKDSSKISTAYRALGRLYDNLDNQKAIEYILTSNTYINNSKKEQYINDANLGYNYAKLKDFKKALNSLNKSLQQIIQKPLIELPPEQQLEVLIEHSSNHNLLEILTFLAETHLLQYTQDNTIKEALSTSIKYYKLADNLIDYYYNSNKNKSTQSLWREKAASIYTRALKAFYLANDTETALSFMEKNKALVLSENIEKQKNNTSIAIPQKYIDIEEKLERQLFNIDKVFEKENTHSIIKQYPIIKDSLQKLRNQIKKEFPDYIIYNKIVSNTSLKDIQNSLQENEVLLQYHVPIENNYGISPNTNGYIIAITKETYLFEEITELNGAKDKITQYIKRNRRSFVSKEDQIDYYKTSHEIYKLLFPNSIKEIIKNKDLTIIPDNYLAFLPFEALATSSSPNPSSFLINNHIISYKYSYGFHHKNTSKSSKKTHVLAVAPVHFKYDNLQSLKNAEDEVTIINDFYDTTLLTHKEANKTNVLNHLENASIIHLATHASATENEDPWLAFWDKKITLSELYFTKNNANLVVLSSCDTSQGKIATGEGIISLARGFFYGGALSTVSSLWQVDDQATTKIMRDFYKNIDKGKSKNDALHLAKLSYINNNSGSELSPYYWASFVLHGDIKPLPNKDWTLYYILGSVLILIILYMLSRKRISQKKALST